MTSSSRKLFWDIVNCQLRSLRGQGCPRCNRILGLQNGANRLQIPEPWSGDIDNASVLFVGANPALCRNEIFPSRDATAPYQWAQYCGQGSRWTPQGVESYFEGRFGVAACPHCKIPYFDPSGQRVLWTNCAYHNVQNQYWRIYNKYYNAVLTATGLPEEEYGFALTDVVHCKGGGQVGVLEASACCGQWTQKVIAAFVNNTATWHSLIFVGRQYELTIPMVLQAFGWNKVVVGTYTYLRKGKSSTKQIWKSTIGIMGKSVDVYYGIPAPSRSNRAVSNIVFLGKAI